jgi:hypothetical protein
MKECPPSLPLAAELGYRTTKAAEIQKEFTKLVAAIASA